MKNKKKPSVKAANLRYEVDAVRKKPGVDSHEIYLRFVVGIPAFLILLSTGYNIVYEFTHNSISGVWERWGSFLVLLFALATGLIIFYLLTEGIKIYIRNQKWLRIANKARVSIVDCQERKNITEIDYNYDTYTPIYELILEVIDQPEAPEINGKIIKAEVSKRIFNRYTRKSNAEIYYNPNKPLSFIIKGE